MDTLVSISAALLGWAVAAPALALLLGGLLRWADVTGEAHGSSASRPGVPEGTPAGVGAALVVPRQAGPDGGVEPDGAVESDGAVDRRSTDRGPGRSSVPA